MILHAVTLVWFYLSALFRGALGFCESCGSFTEVQALGTGYRQHFAYLKKNHGLQGEVPEELLAKISFVNLCINCDGEITFEAGLHKHCCDKVFGKLRASKSDPFDHEPLGEEELARERTRLVVMYKEQLAVDLEPHGSFTCDNCTRAPVCDLAFDAYNTDGDCLASK